MEFCDEIWRWVTTRGMDRAKKTDFETESYTGCGEIWNEVSDNEIRVLTKQILAKEVIREEIKMIWELTIAELWYFFNEGII